MVQFTMQTAMQLMPLFMLAFGGCVMIAWGAMSNRTTTAHHVFVGLVHVSVLGSIVILWGRDAEPLLGDMLIVDKFALFFTAVCTVCSLATVALSPSYTARFGIGRSEYYGMLLFSLAGMFVLVSATNLMTVFLGIELMSMAIYILVGFRRRDLFSNEAALKYFLLGAFAIAFFLYGMALVYGLTGSMNFNVIAAVAEQKGLLSNPPFLLAIAMLLIGFIFKVSAVPFHMWVPDVYQGAPSPVTAFMASAVKAASFAAMLRLFYIVFLPGQEQWQPLLMILAVATMTVGNLIALVQRNVKRMLAYSSIAHAGYILVGMAAVSADSTRGGTAVMYYLVAYAAMTVGAFALVGAMERRDGTRGLELDDYAGLGARRPLLGLAMTVFMFSMAGIPPFSGFFAKPASSI